jgi:hypothetical protein
MSERIKIQHKLPLPYARTASGILLLAERIRELNLPGEATVDWRGWNVAELMWSATEEEEIL